MKRPNSARAALALAAMLWAAPAQAAFVTTNEASLDLIYSQASFGATPVDIIFNPVVIVENYALLTIDGVGDLVTLFGLFSAAPTIFAYFVDSVDWCGAFNVGFAGCGELPGDNFVVESVYAASGNGTELMAHELGHNLGLAHTNPDASNLMFSEINGNSTLTAAQVTALRASGSVQGTPGAEFVTITPVLITVAEPATLGLLVLGLIAVRRS